MKSQRVACCEEVTVIVGLRAHQGNPWILGRLKRLASAYRTPHKVIVVDSGSDRPFCENVASICAKLNFRYVQDNDAGLFSPGRARNIGISLVETRYALLCDIDCVGETDLLERLVSHARALETAWGRCPMLTIPVYHLSQAQTDCVEREKPSTEVDRVMSGFAVSLSYRAAGRHEEGFVAPYSNIVFSTQETFHATGGYSSAFRGHGSEDFEFLVRSTIVDGLIPLPDRIVEDIDGPLAASETTKAYRGFRRFLELSSFHVEMAGLRVFHLWHPRPEDSAWHAEGDKGKVKFIEIVREYSLRLERILELDYLTRSKTALLITSDRKDIWRSAISLRSRGWRIVSSDSPSVDVVFDGLENEAFQIILLVEGDSLSQEIVSNPHIYSLISSRDIEIVWIAPSSESSEYCSAPLDFDWSSYAVRRCGIAAPIISQNADLEQSAATMFRQGDFHSAAQLFQMAAAEDRAVRNLRAAAESWLASGNRSAALNALKDAADLAPGLRNIRRRIRSVKRPILGALLGRYKFSF